MRSAAALVALTIAGALHGHAAHAEGALRQAMSCKLDADDEEAVQQARDAAEAACSAAAASASCAWAQAQWRGLAHDYCSAMPCTLDVSRIAVVRNRIAARSIEEFIAEAGESSESGNGEIGSFRWTLNAGTAGPGHRFIRLVAGGVMTLPDMDPDVNAGADTPLIEKAVRMVAAHEARHRDRFIAVARKACAEISKRIGDTNDIFNRYFCMTGPGSNAAAQRQVDLADGITRVVVGADGRKDLSTEGADYAAASYVTGGLCTQ
jgi:hypothetical protein